MDKTQLILEQGDAWLCYAIRKTVLKESEEALADLKREVLADARIKAYLTDVADYHSMIVSNHKNPDLPIHKLLFLLDIGLREEPEIVVATQKIMEHKDENGVYQSLTNIPKHFGGSGEDVFGWCLCDAPMLLLALLKAGIDYGEHIKPGVDFLVGLYKATGFPCSVSREFGKFRGPGRKDDCCPNASLKMLQLLSAVPEYSESAVAEDTALGILSLWENSRELHPYMYYMGTDFRKLKAPTIWYDLVSVVDTLSHFSRITVDPRFVEMAEMIRGKQDADGLYTPESVYQKSKEWDFGQKKKPSPYLSYACHQIFSRIEV